MTGEKEEKKAIVCNYGIRFFKNEIYNDRAIQRIYRQLNGEFRGSECIIKTKNLYYLN